MLRKYCPWAVQKHRLFVLSIVHPVLWHDAYMFGPRKPATQKSRSIASEKKMLTVSVSSRRTPICIRSTGSCIVPPPAQFRALTSFPVRTRRLSSSVSLAKCDLIKIHCYVLMIMTINIKITLSKSSLSTISNSKHLQMKQKKVLQL